MSLCSDSRLDLVLVNPGGRERTYQQLGGDLTAIEPPLWCRLIAGYALDRGCSVAILDSEAEGLGPAAVAAKLDELDPRLVVMVVFGHQPSASTQQMVPAGEICVAAKALRPDRPILIVGGHVSALPERTLAEEAVDYACKGEGPATVVQLVQWLKGGAVGMPAQVAGLVWRGQEGKVTPAKRRAPASRHLFS
ncbi:Putative Fe-S oxidoreductase (fragment) [Candidatus Terasakiella magnetica]